MVANGAAATLGPGLGMMSRLYFDSIIKELIILFYWLNGFVTSTTDSGRTVRMINALCMLTDTLEYLIDMIRSLITPSFMHIDVALLRPVPFWLELRLNWYQVFATWMANLYICPHIVHMSSHWFRGHIASPLSGFLPAGISLLLGLGLSRTGLAIIHCNRLSFNTFIFINRCLN